MRPKGVGRALLVFGLMVVIALSPIAGLKGFARIQDWRLARATERYRLLVEREVPPGAIAPQVFAFIARHNLSPRPSDPAALRSGGVLAVETPDWFDVIFSGCGVALRFTFGSDGALERVEETNPCRGL